MKQSTKIIVLAVCLLFTLSIQAQRKDYSKEPGYINFGDLASLENDDSGTEVYLEDHLLRMVAKMSKKEDPVLSSVIEKIKLVRVNQFQVNSKNEARIEGKVSSLDKQLMGNNWERIVKSKNKGENASVYIKTTAGDKICGLVVMAFTKGKEIAFVNIVGEIDLEAIGGLTEKFDIPGLDDIKKNKKH